MSYRTLWRWQTKVQVSSQFRGGCYRHQRGAVSRPTVCLQEDMLQRQTILLHPGHGWHHLLVWTRLCWGTTGPTCWATHCLNVRNPFSESFVIIIIIFVEKQKQSLSNVQGDGEVHQFRINRWNKRFLKQKYFFVPVYVFLFMTGSYKYA